jgi:hypothetical protein
LLICAQYWACIFADSSFLESKVLLLRIMCLVVAAVLNTSGLDH